jgi:hypothetical protein
MLANSIPCQYCGEHKVPGGALAAHERACANGGPKRRRRTQYRELFFANNGPGPYVCFFCEEPVSFSQIIVHHVDHDETNNDLTNLKACHRVCHNGYHFKDLWKEKREELLSSDTRGHRVPHTEETRRLLSENHKEKRHRPSDEARAKAAAVNTGKQRSPETRAKISEGHKRRALRKLEEGGGAL